VTGFATCWTPSCDAPFNEDVEHMRITTRPIEREQVQTDLLALCCFAGEGLDALARGLDRVLVDQLLQLLAEGDFEADTGEAFWLSAPEGLACKRVLLVGLGSRPEADLDALREAGATIGQKASRYAHACVPVSARWFPDEQARSVAQALTEGITLAGALEANPTKAKPTSLQELLLMPSQPKHPAAVQEGATRGERIGEAVGLAPALTNAPASSPTP